MSRHSDIGRQSINRLEGRASYIVDTEYLEKDIERQENIKKTGLKTARDGHTILVPQPTYDSHDPLNWSPGWKRVLLIIIAYTAFLPEFGNSMGAIALIPQSEQWHMPQGDILHAQAGSVFMLGAGGLVVVALSSYIGRLPVLFWFMLFSFYTAIWCAASNLFTSFLPARIFNAFFSTAAQAGGLIFIKDVFFFHEYARAINIWGFAIILAPYLGPCLAAFMLSTKDWALPFWVYAINVGLSVMAVITCMDETYYDRQIPVDQQPHRGSRLMRLTGVQQFRSRHRRPGIARATVRPFKALWKIPVALSTLYYVMTFSWSVGINNTMAVFVMPHYRFGLKEIGFFYFTPIIAALLGNLAGYWLHDIIVKMYTVRNQGRFEPEARLWAGWVATPFLVGGLLLLGFSLQLDHHYMVVAMAWGLHVFGTMIATVGVDAYMLDSYPEAPGETIVWLTAARTAGGFVITFFSVKWAGSSGFNVTFGVQGAICAVASLILLILQGFGQQLRSWQGPLDYEVQRKQGEDAMSSESHSSCA